MVYVDQPRSNQVHFAWPVWDGQLSPYSNDRSRRINGEHGCWLQMLDEPMIQDKQITKAFALQIQPTPKNVQVFPAWPPFHTWMEHTKSDQIWPKTPSSHRSASPSPASHSLTPTPSSERFWTSWPTSVADHVRRRSAASRV